MCGISGIMYKRSVEEGLAPVGRDLVNMLQSMVHRGRDSSGITVAGERNDGDLIIRVWVDDSTNSSEILKRSSDTITSLGGQIENSSTQGSFLRLSVRFTGEVRKLAESLLNQQGLELHSIGKSSEVIKDVGTPNSIDGRHSIAGIQGTHGIGHVRMATESRVDISHAHPFWAYPFPDVTVVHNGQLTNYHSMKRSYEDQGHRFQTQNDSELIAVYLADKLSKGSSLNDALEESLMDLDGTFTYLVSTQNGLGYAKDQWSAKPLVTMETEDVVAIASEEVALRSVMSQEIDRLEPQESEAMTWLL
jgi:glutamate synthase domain-containing protein 1